MTICLLSLTPKRATKSEHRTLHTSSLLEREGVMAGMKVLPERIRYAVRQCGGLDLFNAMFKRLCDGDPSP